MVGMGLGNIFSRMGAQGRSNSFLLNWSSANASQFKTAMAATKAGTSNTKILCLGDSTTYGLYGDATLTHMFGWPAQIAPLMSSYGYNGGWQNTFGNGTQTLPSTDTRFVQGSDWINNLNSMGGLAFKAAASAGSNGGNFSFTPSVSVDSFNFWAVKTATAGVIAYSIDGGSYTTLNCNGSNALLKQSVSAGALGTHTLNLKYSSGTQVWATAVEGYDSSTKEVSFWNAGYPGSTMVAHLHGASCPPSRTIILT